MLAAFFRLPRLSKGSKGKRPQATLNLRWDESKHPRGQADNAGQFASKQGASGSQATATAQAGGPRFTQATGTAAKLGQKRTLARVNTRLKFGVEDIVFTEQEKAQSPYTWRVKHVAAACNLFEPMAMWVLDDAMVAALRRECVANDDQVGLMLVDLHRDRRAAFTARQREEARGVVFAMLKQAARAAGNGHNGSNGSNGSNGNGLTKAVTLEELFMPPAAPRTGAVQRFLGWLRKSQMSLFDEDLHPRHPAGSERGGQFREKRSAAQAGGQARKPAAPSVPNAFLAPDGTLLPLGRSENHKMWLSAHRQILKRYIPDPEQALRAESEGTYSFGRLLAHGFARKSSPAGAKVLGYSISALAPDPDAVVGMVAADVDAEVDAHLSRGADIDEVAVQVEVWGEGSSPSMVEFPLGEVASGKSEVLKRLRRGIAQVAPTPEEEQPQEQVRRVGGSYQDRVNLTMEQLGTRLDEWAAVPVKGMVDAVGEGDKPVKAPEFDFPVGYEAAKSPFASSGFGDTNCELCGHPIKRVYWIQHDGKKLLLPVGSECVTLFEGKSGSALAKEAEHQQRVDLLLQGREASRRMYEEFNEGGTLKRTHGKPYEVWQRLQHLTDPAWGGDKVPAVDEDDLARLPERERRMRDNKPATKAQVTRFVNLHEEELRALLAAADELSAGGDPELPRRPSYDPDREAYRQARRLLAKLESGEWEAGGIVGQRRVAELTYMLRLKDGSLPEDTDLSDEQVELWRAGRSANVAKHARKLTENLLSAVGQEEAALQKAIGPRRTLVAFGLRKSQMSLFDEDLHPRHPAGSEQGGQFAPKAGGPRISAAPEADVAEPGPNEREDLYRQAVRQRWPRIPDALQTLERLKKLWRYRNSRWGAHSAAQAATVLKISRREAEQLLRGPIAHDLGWGYSNTAGLDQAYLDVNREPKWPTWEDGWRREQALDREDLDEEESRALEALRAEAATTPGGVIMRGALMGAGFSREDATRLLDLLEARGAIVPTDDSGLAWTLAGDGEAEAEAAPSPYAGERAELQAKLDAVNAKREKHAASAQAFADANYAPGLQADTGGIRSRSQKRKQQMFDRNSRDAQEGLELLAEAEDLEQQIDAIDSGRREAHDAEKAKRKATTPLKRLEEAVYAATVAEAPKGSPEWNEYLAALADAQHKQMNKQVKAAVERGLKRAKKAGPVRKSIVAFRHHEEVVA